MESAIDSLREVVYGSSKQRTFESAPPSATPVLPTVASKVAFPQKLLDFDPTAFLPEPYLTAFTTPSQLLLGEARTTPAYPLTSARGELWHLFWRWDLVDRPCLVFESEVIPEHASNLSCLAKPDGELRQIIDRRPRNQAEADPPKDGPKMGHCSVFVNLMILKGAVCGDLYTTCGTSTMLSRYPWIEPSVPQLGLPGRPEISGAQLPLLL